MTELQLDEDAMRRDGIQTEEPAFEDYFGFSETHQWMFPDGIQYIEYRVMTEGDRAAYQKATSRDVKLSRGSGDATIKLDPSEDRRALFSSSVTGWYIFAKGSNGQKIVPPFSIGSPGAMFESWLNKANPKHVSDLELAIRKTNPWMQSEMTVKAIDEEIANLQELRKEAVEREAGK